MFIEHLYYANGSWIFDAHLEFDESAANWARLNLAGVYDCDDTNGISWKTHYDDPVDLSSLPRFGSLSFLI